MKTFRSILFWMHLVAGLIAGLSIFIMCFTGTVIAFEHEIADWSERDARKVTPPAENAPRLPLDDLQRKLREAQPDFRPTSVTLQNDPTAAVNFSAGREGGYFVNPYTGEARQPASTKMHDFMHLMVDWHRFLGRSGEQRPIGKAINGACNLAFAFLALSGLYLWMPRTWSWRGVKAIALFNWNISGKARDFNWHNAIGLWSAPILIVLTLTAVPISYRWGGNLIYTLVGETPPPAPQPGAAPAFDIKRPSPDARPLSFDAVIPRLQEEFPRWQSISVRTAALQRGPRPATGATATPASVASPTSPAAIAPAPASVEGAPGDQRGGDGQSRPAPQPYTVTIREAGSWPRTATTTLTLNPFTGDLLKREGYADLTTARQVRSWTRYLHTGQALGWGGQLIAGLACLGGCFLVYTGFALSWRRFFGKKPASAGATVTNS